MTNKPITRREALEAGAALATVGMLGPVTAPGTKLGGLRRSVQEATGIDGIEVVLPGTHDTASAVVAVPTSELLVPKPNWCYIVVVHGP